MVFRGLDLRGEPIPEIGMTAAHVARLGVLFVSASGDRAAVHEVQLPVPNMEAVLSMKLLFGYAAGVLSPAPIVPLAPTKSHDPIRAGVRRAIERRGEISLPPGHPPIR